MLATSSLTALLRLSSAVFSFAVLSTPGNAAALDSVSSQTDDSIAGIIREIHSRLPIILDNQHYQLNRTRIWEYIDRGGNPNITFPDRVGVGAHDWSLLSACVARNDVETINMLRARGADINYQNDLGVTPLHWAAYYGHLAAVEALLSPINGIANSMLFDNYGLLPGDYFRIGLLRGTHGAHAIRSVLDSAEETEFYKKGTKSARFKNFAGNFKNYCEGAEVSQKVLKVGLIAQSSDPLSASNIIGYLGDILPGPSIAFSLASALASTIEKRQVDQATDRVLDNYSSVIPENDHARVFRNLAYFLGTLYDDSIEELTENGAKTLGEYSAKKVVSYVESLNQKKSNQISPLRSFAYQIRDYFLSLKADTISVGKTKVQKRDGSYCTAKEVLRSKSSPPQERGQYVKFVLDEQEKTRLYLLISSEESTNRKAGEVGGTMMIHPVTQNEASPQVVHATQLGKMPSKSHIKAGDVSVKADDGAKAAFVVGKSSDNTNIKLGNVEVGAEGQSKAVGILNKSGGTNPDIEAGNLSVQANGNSQAYGFVDDASDW